MRSFCGFRFGVVVGIADFVNSYIIETTKAETTVSAFVV